MTLRIKIMSIRIVFVWVPGHTGRDRKLMKWQTRQPFELDIILGRKEFETILNHKIKGKVATAMEERKEREVPQHK